MLEIKFKTNATENDKTAFGIAVHCAGVKMTISMLEDQISALDKKIENKNGTYTEDEVSGFESKREVLESDREDMLTKEADLLSVYESVRDSMIEGGSIPENVDNVLRCIAAAENSKLEKYALPNLGTVEIYNYLTTCHDLKATSENGKVTMSKAVKNAYVAAEDAVQRALRESLSLEESDYTEKLTIRFNKTDMRLIHETFITGFSNKYSVTKDDNGNEISREYKGVNVAKSIAVKTTKDGDTKYNFTKFNTVIARLVIGKLAK